LKQFLQKQHIQSSVSYNNRLVFHIYKEVYHKNNRLFAQINRLFLSAEAKTVMISEFPAVFKKNPEKDTQEPINSPPICLLK